MGKDNSLTVSPPRCESSLLGFEMTDRKIDTDAANDIDLLQDVVGRARKAGADAADAVLFEGTSLSHARRLGKTEKLQPSARHDLGLRVLIGNRQAIVSTSSPSPKMVAQ